MNSVSIEIEGKTYRVSSLDARAIQGFLDYSRQLLPCPVKELVETANSLPESMREGFIKDGVEEAVSKKKRRGTLADEDLTAFMQTPDGYERLYGLMFRKCHPELTDAQCFDLAAKAIETQGEKVFMDLYKDSIKVVQSEVDVERNFFPSKRASSRRARK